MIHVLYVPKDKTPLDYYEVAKEHNCRQIIHGQSDMIEQHIIDSNEVTIVGIPEYVYLMISDKIIEEGSSVNFKFVNEFITEIKEGNPILEIHKMYQKNSLIEKIEMKKESNFVYNSDYKFDEYGEFLVRVRAINKYDEEVTICEEEIIVYKPSDAKDSIEEEVFSFDN